MNEICLSAVIITKNEEGNIGKLIKSIESVVNEVVVIDDNSVDQTRQIANKLGAKVYKHKLEDFSKQRNFGLKKAKGDWILFLDADESVSNELAIEIKKKVEKNSYKGFYINRRDIFFGKELLHGEAGKIRIIRLAKKNSGKWNRRVHEIWKVNGTLGVLENYLYHNSHSNIKEFMASVNAFSSLHAKENKREGKKSSTFKIILWPTGKFFYNYIVKLGFLDGTRGFVYTVIMSMHSYLAWSKQWTEENK